MTQHRLPKSLGSICIAVIFLLLYLCSLHASPFKLDFSPKADISNEDLLNIQEQLRSINIRPLLEELYIPNAGYTTLDDFYGRCTKGLSLVMIDPERNLFPSVLFEKIGKGGDSCFVTYASFNSKYPSLVPSIATELEKVGFDGYLLCRLGGFPNPTGKEIQYAGVPYSFKVFMMLEAFQKGFNKVIWIDSALLPLNNPAPLFDWLDSTGIFIRGGPASDDFWRYIFPKTVELLKAITGTDVLHSTYVNGTIFGLKMDTVQAQNLIADYYALVEMGDPFLSCFTDEMVFTALLNRPAYKYWQPVPFPVFTGSDDKSVRQQGYYFYHRPH